MLHIVQTETVPMQQMLSARQVQDILHIDRSTVYRMAEDGRLPAIRVGKQWRFPADDIYRVISAQPPVLNTSPLDPSVASAIAELAGDLLGVMVVVTDMDGHPITPIANPCGWMMEHLGDPTVLNTCIAEWQDMADDHTFEPHFHTGQFGFECARAFVRSGRELVAMVLVGGITANQEPGFYNLDPQARAHVLSALPKVAAALSKTASKEETR
jgi:excisionase family DNA binding protein